MEREKSWLIVKKFANSFSAFVIKNMRKILKRWWSNIISKGELLGPNQYQIIFDFFAIITQSFILSQTLFYDALNSKQLIIAATVVEYCIPLVKHFKFCPDVPATHEAKKSYFQQYKSSASNLTDVLMPFLSVQFCIKISYSTSSN